MDISSHVYEREEQERKENEIKLREAATVAREKEALKLSQEGLDINKKALNKANSSVKISILAMIIALASFIKMFF